MACAFTPETLRAGCTESYLVRFAALLFLLSIPLNTRAQAVASQLPKPAVDTLTGIVHSRRLASGVPMGGLGTGTFQVMTDGRIGCATYNNNWSHPIADIPGCFAAVYTRSGARTAARVLALSNAYGLPTMQGLDYDGLFPVAKQTFIDNALPIAVSSRSFSPLIPHDIRNSAFPAAAFIFRLQNTSSAEVEASIALSWENTLGVGGSAEMGRFDDRSGNTISAIPDAEGFFAQQFSSSPATGIGDMRSNARGFMTLMAAPGRPEAIVSTTTWDAAAKTASWWNRFEADGNVLSTTSSAPTGKGRLAGVIAVRVVLKPRETVDIPFAVAWYTPRLNTPDRSDTGRDLGHYYQNLWPDSYSAARALLTEWHSLLALTEEWQERILFSNLPRWMARRLINSVSPITTHSIFTRDESFGMLDTVAAPSWDLPLTAEQTGGHAGAVPGAATAAAAFPPGSRLTSLTRRLVISQLLTDFYPRLAARELRMYMASQGADGAFPESPGELIRLTGLPDLSAKPAQTGSRSAANGYDESSMQLKAIDDCASFVLEVAEYVVRTGDREFLNVYFQNVRSALTYLLESRGPGAIPTVFTETAAPASLSRYLAAMRAGGRLSRIAETQAYLDIRIHSGLQGVLDVLAGANRQSEERALAKRCDAARLAASAAMQVRYWNGHYYADRAANRPDLCDIDQLSGVAFDDRLGGEGPASFEKFELLPPSNVLMALQAIRKLNGEQAGLLGPVAQAHADATANSNTKFIDSPICSIGAAIVGFASLAASRGQPEIAVSTLRRFDETQSNILQSPWQSPGDFDAVSGAIRPGQGAGIDQAADWSLLGPIEGFLVDLTSGQMDLSPQIPGNWRSLSAPIFGPTFWARVEFRPTARGGVTSLRLDRLMALPAATGSVRLSGSAGLVIQRIRIAGPPPRPANAPVAELPVAHVSRGTTPLGVRTVHDRSGDFILTFETPVKLAAGDRLEIDVH